MDKQDLLIWEVTPGVGKKKKIIAEDYVAGITLGKEKAEVCAYEKTIPSRTWKEWQEIRVPGFLTVRKGLIVLV